MIKEREEKRGGTLGCRSGKEIQLLVGGCVAASDFGTVEVSEWEHKEYQERE